jgi:hypothetical protein
MASVSINRGLPRPEAPASSLPKDQWDDLVIVRKLWAQSQLPFDCRMLKLVAADAPEMAKELGYETEEAFLREGLQLDPELVTRVVDWLDREKPEKAVTLDHVKQQLDRHGGDRRSKEACRARENQDDNIILKQQGTSAAYIRARLRRDHPEVAAALDHGEYPSARAAGIAAGFIEPSPSLQLKDPAPTAKKLLDKKGRQWCLELLEELSELAFQEDNAENSF